MNRFYWLCLGLTSTIALTAGSAVILGGDSAVARQLIGLCLLALIALLAAAAAVRLWVRRTGLPTRVELEKDVDKVREEVRWLEAGNVVETSVHQLLYKADIPTIIAQYQAESDKYRKKSTIAFNHSSSWAL
ncbi:hypothetical protein [Nonomuraea salmonea]|uniref:hypothetical protein n=1 Tax=Nonomuraea salmonea TaxID=46181 RepID=UPI0031F15A1B